jgi:hypothetical protein
MADQWKDIAAHLYQNENVRALVFQYMLGHALAGATMSAIAIQQAVQIATAEQDLKNARDNAMKATIDLSALYKSDNGPDQALMYWALATRITTARGLATASGGPERLCCGPEGELSVTTRLNRGSQEEDQ